MRLHNNLSLREAKEHFEIMFINDALQDNKYNMRKTAEMLNIHYSALHRKMKYLGINKASNISLEKSSQ